MHTPSASVSLPRIARIGSLQSPAAEEPQNSEEARAGPSASFISVAQALHESALGPAKPAKGSRWDAMLTENEIDQQVTARLAALKAADNALEEAALASPRTTAETVDTPDAPVQTTGVGPRPARAGKDKDISAHRGTMFLDVDYTEEVRGITACHPGESMVSIKNHPSLLESEPANWDQMYVQAEVMTSEIKRSLARMGGSRSHPWGDEDPDYRVEFRQMPCFVMCLLKHHYPKSVFRIGPDGTIRYQLVQ